jgi:hypothetical protein
LADAIRAFSAASVAFSAATDACAGEKVGVSDGVGCVVASATTAGGSLGWALDPNKVSQLDNPAIKQ